MYFRENLLIEVEFELKLEKNAVDILTLNLGVISLIAHTETPPHNVLHKTFNLSIA